MSVLLQWDDDGPEYTHITPRCKRRAEMKAMRENVARVNKVLETLHEKGLKSE